MKQARWFLSFFLACCAVQAGPLHAQRLRPDASLADTALATCLAAAAPGSRAPNQERDALSTRAEQLWRAELARGPNRAAPLVGLARVLVQCRLPITAGPGEMLGLFQEAVDMLHEALRLEPDNWSPRLTIGLVYAGAPPFLGLAGQAIEHLEIATGPGGIPADRPELAEALQELALLYERSGRRAAADSALVRASRLNLRRQSALPTRRGDSTISVSGITVTGTSAASVSTGNREGRAVTVLDIVTMPGGAADLMQVLQVLPGVTGGSESSELSLRGGEPYEAPVFLNGSRLAHAGKFESVSGSLFGVLDPEVLRGARVLPAGFSARYGDALSGVIEAQTLGRPAARSRRFAVNTAGTSATLMRPLNERAGVWVSTRLTHTGAMLRMHGRGHEYATVPVSVEAITGASHRFARGEVNAVALVEHDDASPNLTIAGHSGAFRSTGSTVAAVVSAEARRAGPFAALRASSAVSSRSSTSAFGVLDYERRLTRAGLRAEADLPAGAALLRAGVEGTHIFESGSGTIPAAARIAPGSAVNAIAAARRADHAGAFSEVILAPTAWLTITPGLRVDRLPGERETTVDPRLAAQVAKGRYSVSFAAGVFQQGSFRPAIEQPGNDSRTGVARRAEHYVFGVERSGSVTARADLYLKRYQRWTGGDSLFRALDGTVTGGDLFVNIPGYERSGHFTYTAMRGRLTLPGGVAIPAPYDVSHSLVAVGTQRFGPSWEVGLTLRLATGRPYTALVTDAADSLTIVLGPPNAERYPAYRRLDSRVSRYSRLNGRLVVAFAEVLNLEGRANVVRYGVQTAAGRGEPITTFYGKRTIILGVEFR
jgi:tetratricopeptide (TPR) repeat protein